MLVILENYKENTPPLLCLLSHTYYTSGSTLSNLSDEVKNTLITNV